MADAWGGSWGDPSAWGHSWDILENGGGGEAEAIVWALKRRKRKQQPQQIQAVKLPPWAVLMEALED